VLITAESYLTLSAHDPLNWPPLFGVMTQVQLQTRRFTCCCVLALSGASGKLVCLTHREQVNGVLAE